MTTHNKPLYILSDFDRFSMARLLVDLSSLVNIMSLIILIYLQIDISQLEANRMILKGFNESSERAIGCSITLTFETNGWVFEENFHIINSHTSFNALLGRAWIYEKKVVPSSIQ